MHRRGAHRARGGGQPDRHRGPDRVGLPGDVPAAPAQRQDPASASPAAAAERCSSWPGPACAASCRSRRPSPCRWTFPQRDLIIFLTFCVIVATLVGQGLTLPLDHPAARRRRPASSADARGGHRPPGGGRGRARAPRRRSPTSSRDHLELIDQLRAALRARGDHVLAGPGRRRPTRPSRSCSTTRRSGWRVVVRPARGDHPAARRRGHRRRGAASRRARPRPGGPPLRRLSAGDGIGRRGGTRATLRADPETHGGATPHEHRRRRAVPVHLRIGDRGSPGQDVRPDL